MSLVLTSLSILILLLSVAVVFRGIRERDGFHILTGIFYLLIAGWCLGVFVRNV